MFMLATYLLIAFGAILPCKAEQSSVTLSATPQRYMALSNNSDWLEGILELSTTSAKFQKRDGMMRLQYAGQREGRGNEFEATGAVYKVLNADEYFSMNKGKNGFCREPIRWLTIQGEGSVIRVGQLSVENWHDYDPAGSGLCSADTYGLASKMTKQKVQ